MLTVFDPTFWNAPIIGSPIWKINGIAAWRWIDTTGMPRCWLRIWFFKQDSHPSVSITYEPGILWKGSSTFTTCHRLCCSHPKKNKRTKTKLLFRIQVRQAPKIHSCSLAILSKHLLNHVYSSSSPPKKRSHDSPPVFAAVFAAKSSTFGTWECWGPVPHRSEARGETMG